MSRFSHTKCLNSVIGGVDNIQYSIRATYNTIRVAELSITGSITSELANESAIGPKRLNAMTVPFRDIDKTIRSTCHTNWMAELSITRSITAPFANESAIA